MYVSLVQFFNIWIPEAGLIMPIHFVSHSFCVYAEFLSPFPVDMYGKPKCTASLNKKVDRVNLSNNEGITFLRAWDVVPDIIEQTYGRARQHPIDVLTCS